MTMAQEQILRFAQDDMFRWSARRQSSKLLPLMTTTSADRDKLRESRFLQGTPETALHQLAKLVATKTFEADELLFEEGTPREFLAIIVSGAVAIEKHHDTRPVRLVSLGAGEAIGEGLLLDDSPHGTSARAIVPTTVFVLSAEQVKNLVREAP